MFSLAGIFDPSLRSVVQELRAAEREARWEELVVDAVGASAAR